jgi:hypothetical protein
MLSELTIKDVFTHGLGTPRTRWGLDALATGLLGHTRVLADELFWFWNLFLLVAVPGT